MWISRQFRRLSRVLASKSDFLSLCNSFARQSFLTNQFKHTNRRKSLVVNFGEKQSIKHSSEKIPPRTEGAKFSAGSRTNHRLSSPLRLGGVTPALRGVNLLRDIASVHECL